MRLNIEADAPATIRSPTVKTVGAASSAVVVRFCSGVGASGSDARFLFDAGGRIVGFAAPVFLLVCALAFIAFYRRESSEIRSSVAFDVAEQSDVPRPTLEMLASSPRHQTIELPKPQRPI